jgi:hypothetical protein
MLSEADKLLITAGVCGCLSRVEKTALRILLEESPAAKALYTTLCHDRDRLAAVPKQTAPDSIWPNVMARVASGPIIVPPIVPNRQGVAGWLPFAVAASLLVGVTALSYKMFLVPANRNEVADKSSKPIVELQPNRISPPLAANETTAPAPVFVGPPNWRRNPGSSADRPRSPPRYPTRPSSPRSTPDCPSCSRSPMRQTRK